MLCPGCGCGHAIESNLFDEAPFVEAAQYAPQLRHYGRPTLAAGLLSALGIVKIANFIRPKWRCACGAKFDD